MVGRATRNTGTALREQIIRAVQELHDESKVWPSPVLVAERLGQPIRTLRYHTRILEADGKIKRLYGGRALEVVRT